MLAFIQELLAAAFRMLTPIGLAAIGEVVVERSGILNLGLEGIMLFGAFTGFIITYYTHNPWLGILAAAAVGVILALFFGFLTITLALDQVITGLALNIFAAGATFFFYRAIFGWYVSPIPPKVDVLITETPIPILQSIPIIGPALFKQLIFTYILIFILVPITYYIIYKTKIGLHLRACGEDPLVADYLGIDVVKYRYLALIYEGVLAGIGGALFTTALYNMFLDNMTGGRGFIAIAMVILGKWNPIKTLLASFLFSIVDALQLRIQAIGIEWFPYQFALMLPYLVTIAVLAIFGRKVKGPASLAKPYRRIK